jgi:endonuclease YncB( thermonuclease family)
MDAHASVAPEYGLVLTTPRRFSDMIIHMLKLHQWNWDRIALSVVTIAIVTAIGAFVFIPDKGPTMVLELDDGNVRKIPEQIMATVRFAVDGDTVELTTGERVRYIGVDTPEKGECYYEEAKAFNKEFVQGKRVRLERDVSDRDQFGRLLRYVSLIDGPTVIDMSRSLIGEGYGKAVFIEPDVSRFHSYRVDEGRALQANLGIWGACQ